MPQITPDTEVRLAAICHDMGQPLQALALLSAQLQGCTSQEKQQRLAGQIACATATLGNMFEQLLAMAQLKGENYQPKPQIFALGQLFSDLEGCFRPLAEHKRLALRLSHDETTLHSDPVLLYRLLSNLLSNAIRYTEHGFVAVSCTRCGDKLLFEVLDSGCGIDAAQLPFIFDAYYQTDRANPASQFGLGLGLTNARSIATLLGTQINVRSRKGEGSVFSFTL